MQPITTKQEISFQSSKLLHGNNPSIADCMLGIYRKRSDRLNLHNIPQRREPPFGNEPIVDMRYRRLGTRESRNRRETSFLTLAIVSPLPSYQEVSVSRPGKRKRDRWRMFLVRESPRSLYANENELFKGSTTPSRRNGQSPRDESHDGCVRILITLSSARE